jgi:uncharacterized membrane protein HdeD (DUF308 family)
MVAGRSTARTIVASIRTATERPTPACLSSISESPTKTPNTPIITTAALVTVPAVALIPWDTASSVDIAAALVILQFDDASVSTVGVLVGLMFLGVGIENIALASLDVPMRWVWAIFGGLFLISAVVAFANPADTFAGVADVLGFLFLIVGVWWMVRAFLERAINALWWLGLISGIVMTALAFWTEGQFFISKAYVLLVFAGIWALMQGITTIVRAFEIRAVRAEL